MAATVHENMLMNTAIDMAGLPTLSWNVAAEGLHDQNYAAGVSERALDGTLQIHRVIDVGTGAVMQFRNYTYRLILTLAEYLTLRGLVGKVVYFMPHYRDDGDAATYRVIVFFNGMQEEGPIATMLTYWKATIFLESATGATPG